MTDAHSGTGINQAKLAAACVIGIAMGWLLAAASSPVGDVLLGPEPKLFWFVSRAAGTTAFVLLTLSMASGLGISTRLFDGFLPRAVTFAVHEHSSWLALAFSVLHGGVLLLDRAEPFSLAQLLLPFTSAYRPGPAGMGILALYGVCVVSANFYVKPHLSHQARRLAAGWPSAPLRAWRRPALSTPT